MRSTIGITIAAPADLVFQLARDIERWPRLLPHYLAVTALEREPGGAIVALMIARRPLVEAIGLGLPVAWRSRTWNEPATRRLRFVHRGGATNGMDVTWTIEPVGADGRACRVEIEHDFRPRIPGWARFIDAVFTRPIAGRTLATFRDLAEAIADDPPPLRTSEPAAATNQPA